MSKRIAVLTHYYPPEPCAAGNRAASLVKALAAQGSEVTVITGFPSFPGGRIQRADAWKAVGRERSGSVTIVRLFTRTFRSIPGGRLLHWISSAIAASIFLTFMRRRIDVLIVTVPPITLALPALLGAMRHRAKLVVDVRDVYPDIAIAMGAWQANGFLARATAFVARALYRRAALVTAVTPTALRQISSRGVDHARLVLAPNGSETLIERAATRRREAKDDTFVAIYAGNLGVATDVDVLLDAAAMLRHDKRIEMWIAGDGAHGDRVRRRARDEHLGNVHLFGCVSREQALQMTAEADLALVPLRHGIWESVPTKIFDAFSVGCPVLVAAEGEARAVVISSGGGTAIRPGDARSLADTISRLAREERAVLQAQGKRGRAYVARYHEREAIMQGYSRRIVAL